MEIARDVAKKLLEARMERSGQAVPLSFVGDLFECPLVVAI